MVAVAEAAMAAVVETACVVAAVEAAPKKNKSGSCVRWISCVLRQQTRWSIDAKGKEMKRRKGGEVKDRMEVKIFRIKEEDI